MSFRNECRAFRRFCQSLHMDEKDRFLLTCLYQGIPLVHHPFHAIAVRVGLDDAEVLLRVQRLKQEGILSEIKGIWNPRVFQYQSAWVAMKFDAEMLREQAEIVHRHPGVIYSCEREHELNFWFFIAVPAEHDLETHVRCLEKFSTPRKTFFLPVRKVFKGTDLLHVMDPGLFGEMKEHFEKRETARSSSFSELEIELIRKLQEAFPVTDEPFRKIAKEIQSSEAQVLELVKTLAGKNCLKRIGSFLQPTSATKAKTLLAWHVSEEKLERIQDVIAGIPEILYSDRRPAYPGFPYSLYTMIQAAHQPEVEGIVRRIEGRIGKWPWDVLVTKQELKKTPFKYFPQELDQWWQHSRHIAAMVF